MQEVFTRASKVAVVDNQGGNNMLYLPLDKIMQQAAQDAGKPSSLQPGPARREPAGDSAGAGARFGQRPVFIRQQQ